MDKQSFLSLFGPLAQWYKREPNALVIRVYWEHLQHLPILALEEAIKMAIATEAFMPTAEKLAGFAGSTLQQRAMEQWQTALALAAQRKSFRGSGLDEATIASIKLLTPNRSLAALGDFDQYQVNKWAGQFVTLYEQHSRQASVAQASALPPASNQPQIKGVA